ncbi:MAG: hypothetical protein QXL24_06810 [Candidatus Jordarchaeaceae archaeon]
MTRISVESLDLSRLPQVLGAQEAREQGYVELAQAADEVAEMFTYPPNPSGRETGRIGEQAPKYN